MEHARALDAVRREKDSAEARASIASGEAQMARDTLGSELREARRDKESAEKRCAEAHESLRAHQAERESFVAAVARRQEPQVEGLLVSASELAEAKAKVDSLQELVDSLRDSLSREVGACESLRSDLREQGEWSSRALEAANRDRNNTEERLRHALEAIRERDASILLPLRDMGRWEDEVVGEEGITPIRRYGACHFEASAAVTEKGGAGEFPDAIQMASLRSPHLREEGAKGVGGRGARPSVKVHFSDESDSRIKCRMCDKTYSKGSSSSPYGITLAVPIPA